MCAGAVIGGGFASGRETISFFTQYGRYGWWLIVLSVGVMVLLALTCMRETANVGVAFMTICPNGKAYAPGFVRC